MTSMLVAGGWLALVLFPLGIGVAYLIARMGWVPGVDARASKASDAAAGLLVVHEFGAALSEPSTTRYFRSIQFSEVELGDVEFELAGRRAAGSSADIFTRTCVSCGRLPVPTKAIPEDATVAMLLCEDVREEARGKISLVGVYAGGDIVVRSTEGARVRTCFYWIIQSGVGTFKARLEVAAPDGQSVIDVPIGDIEKKPENFASLAFLGVMPNPQVGWYNVKLYLDDVSYTRGFWLRENADLPEPNRAVSGATSKHA